MSKCASDIKKQITDTQKVKIGWYSATAAALSENLYIYATPDGKGKITVTNVTIGTGQTKLGGWKDAQCKGVLGRFLSNNINQKDRGDILIRKHTPTKS